jgi:hypothetical protein
MKPLALDLCCGLGGWTDGLLETGWDVIGFDITAWPGYKGKLVLGDVREVKGTDYPGVSLVCASPPCQEFSYRSMPWGRKKMKEGKLGPPDKSIWEACVRIAKECNAPLVLENVRGARDWMGKSEWNCGSFYLWGNVPAIMPTGIKKKKSIMLNGNKKYSEASAEEKKGHAWHFSSKSKQRREWSAKCAMIPLELSRYIGTHFHPSRLNP